MKKYLLYGLLFLALLGLVLPQMTNFLPSPTRPQNQNHQNTNNQTVTTPSKPVAVPQFSADSAYTYVAKQVAFGPRLPNGGAAQKQTKAWLIQKFRSFGAEIIEQPFSSKRHDGVELSGVNIIARYNPSYAKRICFAAHWDSRYVADKDIDKTKQKKPILGADDGASGVGVLLEMARQMHQTPADIGLDLILFDAEDQGEENGKENPNKDNTESWCLGSQHWATNLHVAGYRPKFGILLDMVGAQGARFTKEGISMRTAPGLVNKVWSMAQGMGYGNYFVNEETEGIVDDHYFVIQKAEIPMIDIINRNSDGSFGKYHHTHTDDMSIIDKNTLNAVGQVMLAVLYNEAAGSFL